MARRSKRCVFIKRWQNIYKHHDVQRRCWVDVRRSGVKGQWQLHGRFVVFVPALHVEFIQHSSLKKNKGPLNLGSAYWGEKCSFFFCPTFRCQLDSSLKAPHCCQVSPEPSWVSICWCKVRRLGCVWSIQEGDEFRWMFIAGMVSRVAFYSCCGAHTHIKIYVYIYIIINICIYNIYIYIYIIWHVCM